MEIPSSGQRSSVTGTRVVISVDVKFELLDHGGRQLGGPREVIPFEPDQQPLDAPSG